MEKDKTKHLYPGRNYESAIEIENSLQVRLSYSMNV